MAIDDIKDNPRILLLSDEIKNSTVAPLIAAINRINAYDDDMSSNAKSYERKPIHLYINSEGGYVDDTTALIGAIELSKTPVHTYALGKAYSGAFYLLISGHMRYAHRLANIMFHALASSPRGQLQYLRERLEDSEAVQEMLNKLTLEKTKITKDKLDEVIKAKYDWHMWPDDALKLGVIDVVISKA